jgi:predicted HD superfamily hydrolase involved in NAD metabolism
MTGQAGRESLRARVGELPRGLQRHIEGVVAEARRLARLHGLDEERAELAAWAHDVARATRPKELLRLASELGLKPSEIEDAAPILLHGPLAARLLVDRFGIHDDEVLATVRWHSTGRAGMSPLEKVVFVADKVEPGKSAGQSGLEEARRLAETDLDAATLRLLDLQVQEAVEHGWPLHPDTVAARNELVLARQKRRHRYA